MSTSATSAESGAGSADAIGPEEAGGKSTVVQAESASDAASAKGMTSWRESFIAIE